MSTEQLAQRIETMRASADDRPAILALLLLADSRRLLEVGETVAAAVEVANAADLAAAWLASTETLYLQRLWDQPAADD